ncbi:MAG: DUF1345 domain-containing protein [Serratia symbiotica]|nr:DUF1345 domain-containing protein [Serratia symbiotica]
MSLLFSDNLTEPTYLDCAYFLFTIAVVLQIADVAVGLAEIRKITLLNYGDLRSVQYGDSVAIN